MPKLESVTVDGLFGYVHHSVVVEQSSSPTVITGPNGTGKTHVLRLIDAALHTDIRYLLRAPFERIALEFEELQVEIRRSVESGGGGALEEEGFATLRRIDNIALRLSLRRGPQTIVEVETNNRESELEGGGQSREMPSWIIQLGSGRYYDSRSEKMLPRGLAERRYGTAGRYGGLEESLRGRDYLARIGELNSVLIDTKRLDSDVDAALRQGGERRSSEGEERILGYIRSIQAEIASAREDSLRRSQSADLRFAERALAAATLTVRLEDLKEKYGQVVNLYEEMARNGLAPDETPTGLPEKPNPTAKRIMALLIEDWNRRLAPLAPVNDKLNDLRSILDSKLETSGKRTSVGQRGRLGIESTAGRRIPVARLSSGEQHLLAIFSQLLFATQPGSIVLIDEPEISMHMSWQHTFLDDVRKVAQGSDLQVIIATHSTGIINGRWESVRELALPSLPPVDSYENRGGDVLSKEVDDDE